MSEEQHAAKYISDLQYLIQERVILHDVFSVDEAHNKALKIERLKVGLHFSDVQRQLKSEQVAQKFSRVP